MLENVKDFFFEERHLRYLLYKHPVPYLLWRTSYCW